MMVVLLCGEISSGLLSEDRSSTSPGGFGGISVVLVGAFVGLDRIPLELSEVSSFWVRLGSASESSVVVNTSRLVIFGLALEGRLRDVVFLAGVLGASFLLGVEATVLVEEIDSLRLLLLLVTESASDCRALEEPTMEDPPPPVVGGFFLGRPRPLLTLSFSKDCDLLLWELPIPSSSLLLDC